MATFWPSTKPVSLRPRRKAAVWTSASFGERLLSNPTIGIADCCARAASGQLTAVPPISVMNWRRFIVCSLDPR
jgi:hypothetical protein